ncbi:uncharacterized protein DUF1344 [Hoeflea marina]|uniref:Uncharacterized protein DUF1344 n=1 Tax=Hoeflea marina TaxID=274592 RepID=A0A317PG41_9HYPH|nr:DUF1344 domain-containing protein [Hoeflea marina]PWV97631.1 uncharacterized protein DUF1344 [Hoeflea marina]
MIKIFATASLAALLLAGTAFAAETQGVVSNYDINTRMLTLDTGETYVLVEGVEPGDLSTGADVTVTHEENSTDATAVSVKQ